MINRLFKYSLLILLFLTIINFSNAIITDSLTGRFNLTVNSLSNYGNFSNLTCNSITYNSVYGAWFDTGVGHTCNNGVNNILYNYDDYSVCITYNSTLGTAGIFNEMVLAGNKGISSLFYNGGQRLFVQSGGSLENSVARSQNAFVKHCVIFRQSDGYFNVYEDGIFKINGTLTYTQPDSPFYLGSFYASGTYVFGGWMKNLCIWNRQLKLDEIQTYNNTDCQYSPPPFASIIGYWSFINETKLNYSNSQYNFTVNATVSYSYDIGNITILLNNVVNVSMINVNVTKNNLVSLNFSLVTQQYNITYNVTITNASYKLNGVFLYVDTIKPFLNITSPLNNSNKTQYQTVAYSGYVYDLNLFETCLSLVLLNDSSIVYSQCYTNLTGLTNYTIQYNKLFDVLGDYQYCQNYTDAHTGEIIKESPTIDKTELSFRSIKFWCNDTTSLSYIQTFDKISATPIFNTKSNTKICYYRTSNTFQNIKDKYANHYIDRNNLVWIDEINKYATSKLIEKNLIEITYNYPIAINTFSTETFGIMNFDKQCINIRVSATSTGGGLTEEEHNLFMSVGNMLNTYIPLIAGVFNMLGEIIINIIFLLICVWFSRNLNDKAILLSVVPITNFIIIGFNIMGNTILSNTQTNIILFLSQSGFFIGCIILGTIYLLIPKKEIKPKEDIYSSFYNK